MSKRAYGWDPRLRLRRPISILVIKCTTLLTCIEITVLANVAKALRGEINVDVSLDLNLIKS
jgi:hypothetical protein